MAANAESTPFLASNRHTDNIDNMDNSDNGIINKTKPANSHFRHSIKILTVCLAVLSFLAVGLLIGSFITIQVGPFRSYTWNSREVIQELGTCVFIAFILSTLMTFLQLPILISFIIDLVLPILIFVYSGNIFGYGWPESHWCDYDYYDRRPPSAECVRSRRVARILMGISAGFGFVVGLLYLTTLLLRIIAISRAKFWKRKSGWPNSGYTFQVTLKMLKQDLGTGSANAERGGGRGEEREGGEERQLIQT